MQDFFCFSFFLHTHKLKLYIIKRHMTKNLEAGKIL